MSETQTTETAEIASTRTFYRSDYARFARAIQRARHVKCDPYTAKDVISQANVTVLAQAVADIFADDSPDRFDASKFLAGTQLPPSLITARLRTSTSRLSMRMPSLASKPAQPQAPVLQCAGRGFLLPSEHVSG